jgi:hypothetical protein
MKHECHIIVIDEGDEQLRKKNTELLSDFFYTFYGPKERKEWFKQRFGQAWSKYISVIPSKCHAETSFGFLAALEQSPNLIVELDDDVQAVPGYDLTGDHINNLSNTEGICVSAESKWYNTLENLSMNTEGYLFPRGHPYALETREEKYLWCNSNGSCVLNTGLWIGYPDLDATTILYHGGLEGRGKIMSKNLKRSKIIVNKGTYFAICSMNTAFLPEIVPAFYQLYMNYMNIDRFDDIWSGLFIKKVADHLGDKLSLGAPLVYHDKKPRDVFKDLKKELEGMVINEQLWKIVDSLELEGKNYWDTYHSLTLELEKKLTSFKDNFYREFMQIQIEKMKMWLEITDKLA